MGEADPKAPLALEAMAWALQHLVARNEKLSVDGEEPKLRPEPEGKPRGLAAFRGARAPTISIATYLERIYRYTSCSPSCFVVGFIYVDRMVHKDPGSLVVSLNVHRVVLTSVMVASKVLDDVHYNNSFFARVGGVSNAELNRMELELLSLLDFGVMVSSRVFESYCFHLEKEMAWSGASQKIERTIIDSLNVEIETPENDKTKNFPSPPRKSLG
ncbi:Cyclin-like protein [Dioscorea alata]|uniref:Cyclin-like protein n=1 Tax=Dioscorea alata TaxID=55571 RepID=A0ACB7UP36_DIOAL|nr:Cyclin-like protein [Dioscorea alata]